MTESNGMCVRVCSGRREAILWINPETMDYRVLQCNWFRECIKRGVLLGGHCPAYCDLISGAKLYLRGRRKRNVETAILSPNECELVNYNPYELVEGEFDGINDPEMSIKNFECDFYFKKF